MILNETYPLANGVQIPKLGLGTWFIDDATAADISPCIESCMGMTTPCPKTAIAMASSPYDAGHAHIFRQRHAAG